MSAVAAATSGSDPYAGVPSTEHMPAGKWNFDDSVTQCFDDMLRRSIPQYDAMRDAVTEMASKFVKPKTAVIDLGCSRGDALFPLIQRFGANNQFVGVEVSQPMLEVCRKRYSGYINAGVVEIRDMDLRREFPPHHASVIMSVLTLQFVPTEYRQHILRRVYDHLKPGGAFILVEKVCGEGPAIDTVMADLYYALKASNGYSYDAIERKKASLEGVLCPLTADANKHLLGLAGFKTIDTFWRWCNFAAWVAIKE